MAKPNRSMPPADVIPELAYPHVTEAAEWLERAFGFKVRLRIGNHRVQMVFGSGSLVLTRGAAGPSAVMVRVADVGAHYATALAAGAQITAPPTDFEFGERQYSALDPQGHRWTFSQTIADVDPADWGGEAVEVG